MHALVQNYVEISNECSHMYMRLLLLYQGLQISSCSFIDMPSSSFPVGPCCLQQQCLVPTHQLWKNCLGCKGLIHVICARVLEQDEGIYKQDHMLFPTCDLNRKPSAEKMSPPAKQEEDAIGTGMAKEEEEEAIGTETATSSKQTTLSSKNVMTGEKWKKPPPATMSQKSKVSPKGPKIRVKKRVKIHC